MYSFERKIRADYWLNKVRQAETLGAARDLATIRHRVGVEKADFAYFTKITAGNEVLEYTVFLTVFGALIGRYFETNDFVYSTNTLQYNNADRCIPLLYRMEPVGALLLKEYLLKNKEEVAQVYKHADYEAGILHGKGIQSFERFTHYGLIYHAGQDHAGDPGLKCWLTIARNGCGGFELTLNFLEGFVEGAVALHFLENFKRWIANLETFLHQPVAGIALLSAAEQEKVLVRFNNPDRGFDPALTLADLFEAQAARTPDNVAVVSEDCAITYRQLNGKANQLAGFLRENHAVKPDDLIGIKLDRTHQLLVAILAVLKSGAAYVPIDVDYPRERIAYIEQDSNSKVVIDQAFLAHFEAVSSGHAAENPGKVNCAADLAYIIYTSGTTGNPKGIMIMHKNAVELVNWAKQEFDPATFDVVYASTSQCFDLSIFEMFYPLAIGATVRMLKNALEINRFLPYDRKVLLNTVPSVARKLVEEQAEGLSHVTVLNLAGEPFPVDLVGKLSPGETEVRNLYGPSEDTTYSTVYRLSDRVYSPSVPIGKAIANSQVYVLDENLALVPIGVPGKLYMAGAGLAKGYLNRPKLTREKFVDNPFVPGTRMYDTGDLGRWLPDGNLQFLGRRDAQVKLRGFRIELGEIENALSLYSEAISGAVVAVKNVGGEPALVAYYAGKSAMDKEDLRSYLGRKLPGYMVPGEYVALDRLPLTPNGKIDRKALPEVEAADLAAGEYAAPENALEAALLQLWREVLRNEHMGVTHNFFALGGHSLKAVKLVNGIQQLGYSVAVKDIFEHPTIAGLARRLTAAVREPILPAPLQESYPATSSQRRLWVLSQFEGGNAAYNITSVMELRGALQPELLQAAIDALVARHESLRTAFRPDASGELRQHIVSAAAAACRIRVHDGCTEEAALEDVITRHVNHCFDLSQVPLLKAELLGVGPDRYLLLFTLHHIAGDGWSMEILSREVMATYNALAGGKRPEWPALPIQYKDYACWQLGAARQAQRTLNQQYWQEQFRGELPVLELPGDRARPKVKTFNGATLRRGFSAQFTAGLRGLARRREATLFMGLVAGINGLLYRYTGQTDIILGTPVAGREHAQLENQIGLYLNTLALRTRFSATDTLGQLLEKQKQVLLAGYAHQDYSFDALAEELPLSRDTSRSALFDVMVVLQNQQDLFEEAGELARLAVAPYPGTRRNKSQFDITFSFTESTEGLAVAVEYNTDLYAAPFIDRLLNNLESFVIGGLVNPDQSIARIDYVSGPERDRLLRTYTNTSVAYDGPDNLVDLLEGQAARTPEAVALVHEDTALTYRELQQTSSALAHYLRAHHHVGSNDLVGVKLPRTHWLVVSMLAVLKAGAAYVPIDLNYPPERIAYLERDSACKVTISEDLLAGFRRAPELSTQLPAIPIAPEALAYVIYTSGSTGRPKGVMLTHGNAAALLHWSREEFAATGFELLYAATSHCFDLSVFEMFYPLSIGKTVRVLPDGLAIPAYLASDRKVLINTVPSVMDHLLEQGVALDSVVAVNLAGEPIPIALSNALLGHKVALRNLYGPSEDTTYSSCYRIDKVHEQSLPIGKPLSNTQFYILSEELALQGEGMTGEICISGAGLSKGYLNREALTQEKFVANPFVPGTAMYRTGDLGRWLPDGNIGFIGRKDDQVKVRGYRIELGEIEHALQQQPGVSQAVVLVQAQGGQPSLVAYLKGEDVDTARLRSSLLAQLPAYLVPDHYAVVERIPVTPNGKVDKAALRQLDVTPVTSAAYVAPRTELEGRLAELWQQLLGVDRVGVTDNFFELGGHSLKATKLIADIHREYNVSIQIQELFNGPTIENLAVYLENARWLAEREVKKPVKRVMV